jgi:LysM domain/Transglycosylase SLT domain
MWSRAGGGGWHAAVVRPGGGRARGEPGSIVSGYKGTHRRPKRKRHIGAAMAASAVAVGAGVSQMPATAQAAQQAPSHPVSPASYTVSSGDTLSQIAENQLGDAGLWPRIAHRNGLASTVIYPGEVLSLGEGAAPSLSHAPASFHHAAYRSAYQPHYNLAVSENAGSYSFSGLENMWEAAGGSSATAPRAACIAEHESGGRSGAVSPTNDYGLWQIHDDPAALSPAVSAAAAVRMSGNGANWGAWTTNGSC